MKHPLWSGCFIVIVNFLYNFFNKKKDFEKRCRISIIGEDFFDLRYFDKEWS